MDYSLVSAIQGRKVISFYYNQVHRTVEPHAYGEGKNGKDRLVAWQLSGKPGEQPGWKHFSPEEMSVLLPTQDTFAEPRDGYVRDDPSMKRIYAQV